jgi:hypothetical protein
MNNKEFISYEQSQALSEINYDGDYDYTYHATREIWERSKTDKKERFLPAPLKQQVFRWFRDKYNQNSFIELVYQYGIKYDYVLYADKDEEECENFGDGPFNTYEEAENACIDELLEIAKQQDK